MSGSEGNTDTDTDTDNAGDTDLSANRFGLDIDADLLKAATAPNAQLDELMESLDDSDQITDLLDNVTQDDSFSELVADHWGTPKGEWWP